MLLFRNNKDWKRVAQKTLWRAEPVAYRILEREYRGHQLLLTITQDGMEDPDCDCMLVIEVRNGPTYYTRVAVVYDMWWQVDHVEKNSDGSCFLIYLTKYGTKVTKFIAGLESRNERQSSLGSWGGSR